jgi:tRNA threonylcarbamoyladenosine modification (KEOPS) complex Cgi121 subunit
MNNITSPQKKVSSSLNHHQIQSLRYTTAVSCVPKTAFHGTAPLQKPVFGDVALVRVVSIGGLANLEQEFGQRFPMFVGTEFVGVFANRYAPDQYEGLVSTSLDNPIIELLNPGGTIGTVLSRNTTIGEPTKVEVIAFFQDAHGKIINTLDYGIPTPSRLLDRKQEDKTLIVITGSSMNAGKSHTAKMIVYGLTQAGKNVVAGKITGTAAKKDILLMQAAGAKTVVDFTSFGFPSTYKISEDQLTTLFWRMYTHLNAQCPKGGYIVLEIADGVLEEEAYTLLSNFEITETIDHLVFSARDALSAFAGVCMAKEEFDMEIVAVSGPIANSPLAVRELHMLLPEMPVFHNMILDAKTIEAVFINE